MAREIKVGRISDFANLATTLVTVEGQNICVARVHKEFYAFPESCTHAEASLANLEIEDGVINCPLHGARFMVSTGQAITPPATEPLLMIKTETKGEDVFLTI